MNVFGGLLLLGLVALVQANPYLDVHLRAHAPFVVCVDGARCNISYSFVLLHANNHHNLQSLLLQEPSCLRKIRDDTFEEHTVVALTRSLRRSHGKTFVGVQLSDLPPGTQDFYLVDVTDTIHLGERAKILSSSEDFLISVVAHRRHESAIREIPWGSDSVHRGRPSESDGCQCVTKNCGCCEHLVIKKIHLDDNACLNITYLSEDIGVRLAFSVNERIYVSREISLRNPPPFCFDVPHLREFASICIRLYDVHTSRTQVSGCAELDAKLYHVHVARVHLGCFTIPI
ncbi:hypothetical protein QR680_009078 [Steinernema hermaphroditum]|uniref:DUF4773 domain-containing protein n=1 Tax=Steinernema hermaphroditum TaxID=289476 RepID=A0AA39IKS3_9BILA|nr:hypothetical protein QR680_009078 [Steinernema hermaphroditum]